MTGARVALLEGIDYEPLLASWPETSFDQQLLNSAPVEARYVLKQAFAHYHAGHTEDVKAWDEWLALFEDAAFGPNNEGVRVSLLGLLFLRHEARHHLDFYSTPLGWFFPSLVAGQYSRLRQLSNAQPNSPEARDLIRRLARSLRILNYVAGNIPRLDEKRWYEEPLSEKTTKLGIFRFRRDRTDPQIALASIQPLGAAERALSVNSILEARAIIETSGHVTGRLRAAGASREQIVSAVELLLRLSVHIARDDYWALLNVGLPATKLTDAAAKLVDGGPQYTRLMLATWFALHIQIPTNKDLGIPSSPTLRANFALNELFKLSDEEVARPNVDWDDVLEQISSRIGGLPLLEIEASHKRNLDALQENLSEGRQFSGLAYEHISYLLNVAREGHALRHQPLTWLDHVGWPEEEDPLLIANWDSAPPNIRTAWSRLTRVYNLVRTRTSEAAIIEIAKSLF